MYTQCPQCLTVYKLTGADLAAARGHVRCAYCNAVFDALSTVSEILPAEPIGQMDRHAELAGPPQLALCVYRPPSDVQGNLEFNFDDRPRARSHKPKSPQFVRTRRYRPRRTGAWLAASLFLMLTLAAQIAWVERAEWMNNANLRPWLEKVCARFDCALPLRRDDDLLQLASRDIRPHPSVPGALIISATVHNVADFAQPFPNVEITLSDLDERRIAMRRFLPEEYVPEARARNAGLAPAATASLVFEVADPGKNAVAFEFKFD
jgi:predicted Zn finger-like uncharacterized protein